MRRRLPLLRTTLALLAALIAAAVTFLVLVEVGGVPLGRILFERFDVGTP